MSLMFTLLIDDLGSASLIFVTSISLSAFDDTTLYILGGVCSTLVSSVQMMYMRYFLVEKRIYGFVYLPYFRISSL